jgi:hypothetical protein
MVLTDLKTNQTLLTASGLQKKYFKLTSEGTCGGEFCRSMYSCLDLADTTKNLQSILMHQSDFHIIEFTSMLETAQQNFDVQVMIKKNNYDADAYEKKVDMMKNLKDTDELQKALEASANRLKIAKEKVGVSPDAISKQDNLHRIAMGRIQKPKGKGKAKAKLSVSDDDGESDDDDDDDAATPSAPRPLPSANAIITGVANLPSLRDLLGDSNTDVNMGGQ